MSRIYDNWERLVAATLKREQLCDLVYCESFSSKASDFSLDSFHEDVAEASGFPSKTSNLSYSDKSSSSSLPTQKAEILPPNVKLFSYNELKYATRNFDHLCLLPRGASLCLFKGWINEHTLTAAKPGDGSVVSVMKLKLEKFQDQEKWLRKVYYLGQLCHPNLVKLIGYCSEGENRMLVCECMPNGSLSDHLPRGFQPTLPWNTRIDVAIGIARGLSFLHERDSELIHGDVNSSNILLDKDFNAKLSGFTLAKLPPLFSVSPRPLLRDAFIIPPSWLPYGYNAPEYVLEGKLTTKCDVYSFGVVLFELLSGGFAHLRGWFRGDEGRGPHFGPWMEQRSFMISLDTTLQDQYPPEQPHEVASLALLCVSSDPEKRPCLKEVLGALEKMQGRCGAKPSRLGKTVYGQQEQLFQIMDLKLEGQYPQKAASTAATYYCFEVLNQQPKLRPCMAEVSATLEELQPPKTATENSKTD
ncbi:Serine/threonine protein kinase [Handroanthus impetiginosus]|uniref:Serine/threonine protein kinase n=1 Tax=Handroanthus impetiginosus TaxID=429701 RepID=A0A2G9I5E7_9LAMI|nr:Serine/threonine protein kinase [Handroanthus impetiginosus]